MAETALAALYRAVGQRLTAQSEVWGPRAFPVLAKVGTPRPYVLFAWAGGGELNQLVKPDAEIMLTVVCAADTLAVAFHGAGRISALLNDADASNGTTGTPPALDGGADWQIIHVNQEQIIEIVELVDGAWVYREGHRFRVLLEAI